MALNIMLQPAELSFATQRDEPILSAAIRLGIGMPYGCRDGACGTCKSRLLAGRVIHGAHQAKALSVAEEAAGYILPCCAAAQTDCVIEARMVPGAGEFALLKMPTRVLGLQRASADVMLMRLQLPANQNFRFRAGQYLEFILPGGARRSYSMATAPHLLGQPPTLELHIRHLDGGLFTDALFSSVKVKDILRIEGPFGTFTLREDDPHPIVLLASGTGLAPIKAIIEDMQFKGMQRPSVLYWGCRTRADLYLHEWAEQAAAQMPQLRYVPVLSEPLAQDHWRGRTGFVHEAVMTDLPDLSTHQVYACGAPPMVQAARQDFTARCGLPEAQFFADAFLTEADKHAPA